jgi:hypothetical protein
LQQVAAQRLVLANQRLENLPDGGAVQLKTVVTGSEPAERVWGCERLPAS